MIGEGDVKTWRRINSVLRAGEDVGKWAVDERLLAVSRERMGVARRLDGVLNRERQGKAKAEWFERKAAEMEMEVDDEVRETLRGSKGEEEGEGGKGPAGEEARRLRRELEALLRKRVEDGSRPHANFFTLNIARQLLEEDARAKRGQQGKKGQAAVEEIGHAAAGGQAKETKPVKGQDGEAERKKPPVKARKGKAEAVKVEEVKEEAQEQAVDVEDGDVDEEMRQRVEVDDEAAPVVLAAGAVGAKAEGQKLSLRAKKNQRKQRQKMKAAAAGAPAAAAV